jgi:NodT family efflux transporter outer membrane factor (OMF) lipoprotein
MRQGIAVDLGCFRMARAPMTRVIVLACALGLGGCAVGPRFTRPTAPLTARYTGDTLRGEDASTSDTVQHIALGREIEGNWWTLFRSDAIDRLVTQALEHNRSLVASIATLAQAQELAQAQAGSRYPQVDLTAGVGRQQYGDEFLGGFGKIPAFTYFAVGPTVSYTLDYTGGVARSVEQQYALAEVERHQLDAAYLTVTGQVVMQTLAIASARAQIATVETILAQDRDNLRLVQTAFDNGSVSREDIVSAQSQIANDMTLLPSLRQDLVKARHALSVVLGRVPASELPPDVDLAQITLPLEVPVSLPSELAHRRPDILAAEAQLHAATSAVGVAQSNLYPKIQLSASVGQQSLKADQLFDRASNAWSIISGLTAPIFDGCTSSGTASRAKQSRPRARELQGRQRRRPLGLGRRALLSAGAPRVCQGGGAALYGYRATLPGAGRHESERAFGGRVESTRRLRCDEPTATAPHLDFTSKSRGPRLPNAAGFLGVHGLAFGALKRLAELFEVLDGVIHAHPSHRMRVG